MGGGWRGRGSGDDRPRGVTQQEVDAARARLLELEQEARIRAEVAAAEAMARQQQAEAARLSAETALEQMSQAEAANRAVRDAEYAAAEAKRLAYFAAENQREAESQFISMLPLDGVETAIEAQRRVDGTRRYSASHRGARARGGGAHARPAAARSAASVSNVRGASGTTRGDVRAAATATGTAAIPAAATAVPAATTTAAIPAAATATTVPAAAATTAAAASFHCFSAFRGSISAAPAISAETGGGGDRVHDFAVQRQGQSGGVRARHHQTQASVSSRRPSRSNVREQRYVANERECARVGASHASRAPADGIPAAAAAAAAPFEEGRNARGAPAKDCTARALGAFARSYRVSDVRSRSFQSFIVMYNNVSSISMCLLFALTSPRRPAFICLVHLAEYAVHAAALASRVPRHLFLPRALGA